MPPGEVAGPLSADERRFIAGLLPRLAVAYFTLEACPREIRRAAASESFDVVTLLQNLVLGMAAGLARGGVLGVAGGVTGGAAGDVGGAFSGEAQGEMRGEVHGEINDELQRDVANFLGLVRRHRAAVRPGAGPALDELERLVSRRRTEP